MLNEKKIEKRISSILHGNYGTSHEKKLTEIMRVINFYSMEILEESYKAYIESKYK